MKWFFPKNDGGRDSGFHDAGVETFKGNFDQYLARELIQNSLDARLDLKQPVRVKFEMLKIRRRQIPDIEGLQATYVECGKYWKDDPKAQSFFEHATKLAAQPQLNALKVSDYNTTGVPGSDDQRTGNWYHLVRSAGSSSKWGGEGGSFGIGKNAPFAASNLRAVFYSTMTSDRKRAFQGVATLVSHKKRRGMTAQPTGFLGTDSGASVRVSNDIPREFRRAECGLDIIILEYPAAATWQNDLMYSVLDNFWPAIDIGDLVVTVGDQTIEKSNLPTLLEAFSGQDGFNAHHYYKAHIAPAQSFREQLPNLEEVSLYLSVGNMELPKKVAMVRKTGMVIFQKGYLRSIVPFCGVFLCRNEKGNRLLREMEPPRHDEWDPDHPERGANKRIESEYMAFIRECINKLVPVDDSKVITIPGLNRFLPDDDETPDESFDSGEATSKEETPDRALLPETIEGRKIDPRRQTMQPDKSKAEGDEEETEEVSESEGSGGGSGQSINETKDGQGGGGGGSGNGNAEAEKGGKGGVQSKPSVPIRYRTFSKDAEAGIYSIMVALRAISSATVVLQISAVGDDQKVPIRIKSACIADGMPIAVSGVGILGPVQLEPEQMLRLEVQLSEAIRVAMEVSAHEA